MSAREWATPGTVALATVRGVEGVRVFRLGLGNWGAIGYGYPVPDYHVTDVRPLVVLDLAQIYPVHDRGGPYVVKALRESAATSSYQATLNAIAHQVEEQTRDPKPAEPEGLGAVIEDAEGARWVKHQTTGGGMWFVDGVSRTYDRILATRVLSEGVGRAPEDEEGA